MHEVNIEEVLAETDLVEVVISDDDETPEEFVVELLHGVFRKPILEAIRLTQAEGDILCGIYPRELADALLGDARQRIRASGHPLVISSEAPEEDSEISIGRCKLCGDLSRATRFSVRGTARLICDDCRDDFARNVREVVREKSSITPATR